MRIFRRHPYLLSNALTTGTSYRRFRLAIAALARDLVRKTCHLMFDSPEPPESSALIPVNFM
jgi:hypothetical protein